MKKILNIKVIISVILIVSALILVFLPNDCCLKDYKENAVTELLSILITVVIIDFFIQKKNEKVISNNYMPVGCTSAVSRRNLDFAARE